MDVGDAVDGTEPLLEGWASPPLRLMPQATSDAAVAMAATPAKGRNRSIILMSFSLEITGVRWKSATPLCHTPRHQPFRTLRECSAPGIEFFPETSRNTRPRTSVSSRPARGPKNLISF